MKSVDLLFVVLFLTSCVLSPATKLNRQANATLETGNYKLAREQYQRALSEAQRTSYQQEIAITMYGLARANGYLCNFQESEQWFLKSIALRENITDSSAAYISQNLLELARLYIAQKKFQEAAAQFERAVPILEEMNIEAYDPIAYADTLEDYQSALHVLGRVKDAERIHARIQYLRTNHHKQRARFKVQPYPEKCD